jgi:hypothetical protein
MTESPGENGYGMHEVGRTEGRISPQNKAFVLEFAFTFDDYSAADSPYWRLLRRR